MPESGSATLTGVADLAEPSAGVDIESLGASLTGSATTVWNVPPVGTRRRVVVTNVNGAVLGELENAVLGGLTFELNKPDSFSFTLRQNDDKVPLILDVPFREVQIYRGDQLLTWGPVVRRALDKGVLATECKGALWHLGRRHIGKANRHNYVNNPSFEDGLTHWRMAYNEVWWYFDNAHAQQAPDGQVVTYPTVLGRHAMRLENFVAGADSWASQDFEWTVDGDTSPNGDLWTLKGYCYMESFTAAPNEERGLYLERFSTTELNPDPNVQFVLPGALKSLEVVFVALNEEFPLNRWERLEKELTTPVKGGEPEIVNVRLYAPVGVVYWDAISLTLIERLAFYSKDQTSVIAKGIVEHLQNPSYDKSDVNIATNCPPSGVLRTREYIHSEHPNGLGALEEFNTLDNGFDFDVTYTPTTRTFNTYYPRKGNYKPGFGLELGITEGYTNIAEYRWNFDGEAAANSIVVLGTGNGSDREEGAAVDSSQYADSLLLEEVFVSPPETTIDALDNMAAERLAAAAQPVSLEITTTPPQPGHTDLVGMIWPGDTIPVQIERRAFSVSGKWRVQKVTINPDDTLDLTLNKRADDQ